MANVGTKTPVSILNEYAIKKGLLPKFDLIMNGSGMPTPKFAYAVQFLNHVSLGEGRSKQEAKHQAARKLLEQLNIECEDEYEKDVKLVVPHEHNLGYNAVGKLVDFCGRTCYPEPIYDVSEVGPPHEKTFTMRCSVSKLSTIGEARTKKEAKHIAAHKMLMQLQREAGEEPMAVALPKKPTNDYSEVQELQRVTPVYQPQVQMYKDYCNGYLSLDEKSETLGEILKNWNDVTLKNACKLVLDISLELAVEVIVEKIGEHTYSQLSSSALEVDYSENSENVEDEYDHIFITMQLHPPLVATGWDVPTAAFNLLNYMKEFTI